MYNSIVNVLPPVRDNQLIASQVLNIVGDRFETIAFSIDDALKLMKYGGVGSFLRVWNFNDFSEDDRSRLYNEQIQYEMEFRYLPDATPHLRDYIGLVKHTDKRYRERNLEWMEQIVIHHTVSEWRSDMGLSYHYNQIATYHVNERDWPGIGYHFLVAPNGVMAQTNNLSTISYHVGEKNSESIGIALIGNFVNQEPKPTQIQAASVLVRWLRNESKKYLAVKPHKYVHGTATQCPGNVGLSSWLKTVSGLKTWL